MANYYKKNMIKRIKIEAHIAAQKMALEVAQEEENFKAMDRQDSAFDLDKIPLKIRERALGLLVEAGFPRCFLQYVDGEQRQKGCVQGAAPARGGCRGDRESWTSWEVFNSSELEAFRTAYCSESTTLEELASIFGRGYNYSGAGGPFAHEGHVKVVRTRYVHSQSGGLDI